MAEKSYQISETSSSKLSWSAGDLSIGKVDDQEVNEDRDTVIRAVRRRPKAVAWCVFAIFILLVSSYTNIAGNSVLEIPQFRKDFGYPGDGDHALPVKWQAAYFGGGVAAAVLGAFSAAWTADSLGRKPALSLLMLLKLISIVMEVVATDNSVYFAALFLGVLTWGGFSGVVVTYVAEVSPLRLRGILTAAVPLAIYSGGLFVALIIKYTGEQQSRWAYRTTFVSQFGFAGIAVIVLPFMPESPWWLVQSGRHIPALSTLRRLSYNETEAQAQAADILRTLNNSKGQASDASYLECFRGTNLRRTIISVMPMSIQALSGFTFVSYYSTYYQQLAGYSTETSFHLFIVQMTLSMFGIICSLPLIDRVGRRNLTLLGMAFLTVSLVITGGLAVAGTKDTIKGTVALLLLYCYVYNLTIGATSFSLCSEIATARLRTKTASLTFALQGVLLSMWGLVLPYLFNPDKANLGAKVAFIFGGISVLSMVYLWFYQPEVAGRSYEELDEMFRRRLPARQFRTWKMAEVEREV